MASSERYEKEYAYTGGPPKAEDAQKTAGETASAAKDALPSPPKDVSNPFQGLFGGASAFPLCCVASFYPWKLRFQCARSKVPGPWSL